MFLSSLREEKQSVESLAGNQFSCYWSVLIKLIRTCFVLLLLPQIHFIGESLEVLPDKYKQWEFMIDDSINPSYFVFCGLNRTLKGTLHQLEYHINNFSHYMDEMIKYYQEEQKNYSINTK